MLQGVPPILKMTRLCGYSRRLCIDFLPCKNIGFLPPKNVPLFSQNAATKHMDYLWLPFLCSLLERCTSMLAHSLALTTPMNECSKIFLNALVFSSTLVCLHPPMNHPILTINLLCEMNHRIVYLPMCIWCARIARFLIRTCHIQIVTILQNIR